MRCLNAASAVEDALCAARCCSQVLDDGGAVVVDFDADLRPDSRPGSVFRSLMYGSSERSKVYMTL
jgi:hypothetical protein